MSSDFSNIQNENSKVYRVFWQILLSDRIYLFQKKIGKIRNKEARVLCFVDGNNFSDFKFVQENTLSKETLIISAKGAEVGC